MNRNHWHDYQFSTSWSLSLQSCKIVEDQERHRPPNASENPGRVLQTSSIPPKRYSIFVLLISKFFWVFLTLLCAKIAGVLHILWNHGKKYLLAQLSPLATSLGSWKPAKLKCAFTSPWNLHRAACWLHLFCLPAFLPPGWAHWGLVPVMGPEWLFCFAFPHFTAFSQGVPRKEECLSNLSLHILGLKDEEVE